MSEAVHLGKPVFSVPIEGQFEQVLNALYLEHLGYGMHAASGELKTDAARFRARIEEFLGRNAEYRDALRSYRREHAPGDNGAILRKVDTLLDAAART